MTTIATHLDPRREVRLAEELDRAVRHSTHAPRTILGHEPRRRPATSVVSATSRRFVDLLELAQRGLVENTITDAGHRVHNPRPGNLNQDPPGDYIVVSLRVVTVPTAKGLDVWRLGPCTRCGTSIERNGRGELLHLDRVSHAHDHAAAAAVR